MPPEAPAICPRLCGNWLVGWACGEPMLLVVTKSPLSDLPYDELVVERCAAGHISTSHGVLSDD